MPELHYGHDLHGAMVSGYVRRARKAARDLLYNADGWRNPYKPRETPGKGLGLAVEELCEQALRQGIEPAYVQDVLKRQSSDRSLEQMVRGANRPDHYATSEREDPAAGFEFEDVEAEMRRYGYRGKLDADSLLKSLRMEFNLRRQTQIERDELLKELDRD